eukprot:m51a1_g11292 hypothetical protein (306) ;mRNA; r:47896-49216
MSGEPHSEAALRTAWLLRTLVLPSVCAPSALCSLALSCPPLLASVALGRLRAPRVALADALVRLCCSPPSGASPASSLWARDAVLRLGRLPFSALLLAPHSSEWPPLRKPDDTCQRCASCGCGCGCDQEQAPLDISETPDPLLGPLHRVRRDSTVAARVALVAARAAVRAGAAPRPEGLLDALASLEASLLGGQQEELTAADGLALACALGAADAARALGLALGRTAEREARKRCLVSVADTRYNPRREHKYRALYSLCAAEDMQLDVFVNSYEFPYGLDDADRPDPNRLIVSLEAACSTGNAAR